MPRCRVDDLARIVFSTTVNAGRLVVVERPARLPDFEIHPNAPGVQVEAWVAAYGFWWLVRPVQPLAWTDLDTGESRLLMEPVLFPDNWLEPLRDPLPDDAVATNARIGAL